MFENEIIREVRKGIYRDVEQPGGGVRLIREGEEVNVYRYATNDTNDRIRINGRIYKVKDNYEFSIKIQRTQIQACGGAAGLLKFLTKFQNKVQDYWEQKIILNCRAVA